MLERAISYRLAQGPSVPARRMSHKSSPAVKYPSSSLHQNSEMVDKQERKKSFVKIEENLQKTGYAHIKSDHYFPKINISALREAQLSYKSLEKDPNPGNRYRAYTRFIWDNDANDLVKDPNNDYFQPKSYNTADGGKIRQFKHISDTYLNNPIIKKLIKRNVDFAKKTNYVSFNTDLEVGLHQIRYLADAQAPAYSSPVWFHKDNEPLVYVHLLNLSKNAVGGTNFLAKKATQVDAALQLTKPLETFVVNQNGLHSVSPLGTKDGRPAFRDILLVTFFNRPKRGEFLAEYLKAKNGENTQTVTEQLASAAKAVTETPAENSVRSLGVENSAETTGLNYDKECMKNIHPDDVCNLKPMV